MGFRFGRVPPVEHLVLLEFTDAHRNMDIRVAIIAAGFQQQNAHAFVFGQPIGQYTAR